MKKKYDIFKTEWHDGSPAVTFSHYDYSQRGLETVAGEIAKALGVEPEPTLWSLDTGLVDIVAPGKPPIKLLMDNYTFTFSCADEALRDKAYDTLAAITISPLEHALRGKSLVMGEQPATSQARSP